MDERNELRCANCGATMTYNPVKDQFECKFCGRIVKDGRVES